MDHRGVRGVGALKNLKFSEQNGPSGGEGGGGSKKSRILCAKGTGAKGTHFHDSDFHNNDGFSYLFRLERLQSLQLSSWL